MAAKFADQLFKCIFLNENVWIQMIISLKFIPLAPINNFPASLQVMAWLCDITVWVLLDNDVIEMRFYILLYS